MRLIAVLAAVLFQILPASTYCANSFRQKVDPRDCDTLQNSRIADLVLGADDWGLANLHPPWLRGDSIMVMRVNTGPLQGLVEFPFEFNQVMWFGEVDTVDVVTIRQIDSSLLFEEMQHVAPTWYAATYCAVIGPRQTEVKTHMLLPLDATVLNGGVIYSGQRPRLETVECIDSLGHAVRTLALEYNATNVMTGEEAAVAGFWECTDTEFRYMGSVDNYEYHNRPQVYSRAAARSFRDVDSDGKRDIVLRYNSQRGAGQASILRDSVSLAFRPVRDSGHPDSEWVLVPIAALIDSTSVFPLRSGTISRVYPSWDGRNAPLTSPGDSITAQVIDASVAALVRTKRFELAETTRDAGYSKVTREGTATANAWLSHDSIYFDVLLVDSAVSERVRDSIAPSYDVLFWIDPRHPSVIDDSLSQESCLLVALTSTGTDGASRVTSYSLSSSTKACDYELVDSRTAGFNRVIGFSPYKFSFALPRSAVGLTPDRPGGLACGFAIEVVDHQVEICSVIPMSKSRSDRRFSRENPATWGNLIIGIREDLANPRRR